MLENNFRIIHGNSLELLPPELAKFDFNKPTFNYYEGAVY